MLLRMTEQQIGLNAQLAGGRGGESSKWLGLACISVAQLMVALDATVINIALPSAQHALGISDPQRQWVITAYTLAFGGLLILGGRVADSIGRKRAFLAGLAGLGRRRRRPGLCRASRRPRGAGRMRRAPGADRAVTAGGHVHRGEGTREGVRGV